jgi:alpha-glucosidase (family GH31 glycosyl hydrolase)
MWHAWERRQKCTRFWWESQKEKDNLENQGVDGIRMDRRETGWRVWIGFNWLRIGTSGELQ